MVLLNERNEMCLLCVGLMMFDERCEDEYCKPKLNHFPINQKSLSDRCGRSLHLYLACWFVALVCVAFSPLLSAVSWEGPTRLLLVLMLWLAAADRKAGSWLSHEKRISTTDERQARRESRTVQWFPSLLSKGKSYFFYSTAPQIALPAVSARVVEILAR